MSEGQQIHPKKKPKKKKPKQTEIKWKNYKVPAAKLEEQKGASEKGISIRLSDSPRYTLESAQMLLKAMRTALGPHPLGPVSEPSFKALEAAVDESLNRWNELEKHFVFTYTINVNFQVDEKQHMTINGQRWEFDPKKDAEVQVHGQPR